jgi:hypothetical protein
MLLTKFCWQSSVGNYFERTQIPLQKEVLSKWYYSRIEVIAGRFEKAIVKEKSLYTLLRNCSVHTG